MNILFRAEGNKIVGLGHLYRISRLACQLTSSGHACTILTAHLPAELKTSLDICGVIVLTDHVLFLEDSVPQNCSNLEQPISPQYQIVDASNCISILKKHIPSLSFDVVLVDSYRLSDPWESYISDNLPSPLASPVIVCIDDVQSRSHSCDILIDQNVTYQQNSTKYDRLISFHCKKLIGSEYAILDPVYGHANNSVSVDTYDPDAPILIYFGSVDKLDLTSLFLKAFMDPRLIHEKLLVVVGSHNSNSSLISALANERGNCGVFYTVPSLFPLLLRCKASIGAGGSTILERLCLGVPSFIINDSLNQEVSTSELVDNHLIYS